MGIKQSRVSPVVLGNPSKYLHHRLTACEEKYNYESSQITERFILGSYKLSSAEDGLKSVMKSIRGRKYFEEFVDEWVGIRSKNGEVTIEHLQKIIGKILGHVVVNDSSELLQGEVIFRQFLDSKMFQKWRDEDMIDSHSCFWTKKQAETTLPELSLEVGSLPPAAACHLKVVVAMADVIIKKEERSCDRISCANHLLVPFEQFTSDDSGDPAIDVVDVIYSSFLPVILSNNSSLFLLLCSMEDCPMPFMLCQTDCGAGYPIIYANKHYESFMGNKRRDAILDRKSLLDMYSTVDVGQRNSSFSRLTHNLKRGYPFGGVLKRMLPDGSTGNHYISTQPIMSRSGKYVYVASVLSDSTSVRHLRVTMRHINTLWNAVCSTVFLD